MLSGLIALLTASVLTAAPLKLAAPGLNGTDVEPTRAQFFNEYFAEQLAQRGGFQITTQSEVAALIGIERQRQLLGCSDEASSCVAEIAAALGVDGVIVGSIIRFGETYAMTLKVISAKTGATLASASARNLEGQPLLDWLAAVAETMAQQVRARTSGGAGATVGPPAATATPAPTSAGPANAIRLGLPVLTVEYARRLVGGLFAGVRVGVPGMGGFGREYAQTFFPGIEAGAGALLRLSQQAGATGLRYGFSAEVFGGPYGLNEGSAGRYGARVGVGGELGYGGLLLGLQLRVSIPGIGTETAYRWFIAPSLSWEWQFG